MWDDPSEGIQNEGLRQMALDWAARQRQRKKRILTSYREVGDRVQKFSGLRNITTEAMNEAINEKIPGLLSSGPSTPVKAPILTVPEKGKGKVGFIVRRGKYGRRIQAGLDRRRQKRGKDLRMGMGALAHIHTEHLRDRNLRKLARRGGIKRMSGVVMNEAKDALYKFLNKIVGDSVEIAGYRKKKTLSMKDVLFALRRNNRVLYTHL